MPHTHDHRRIVLVTTKTCPNCRSAKNYLNDAGIDYDVILADEPDGEKIAREYNIMQAPTLIVPDQDDTGVKLYENVSNIREFLEHR